MEREHVQVATNKAVSVLGYACSLACRSNSSHNQIRAVTVGRYTICSLKGVLKAASTAVAS